ncbi:MAG: SDR family oxidoreductase [Alphaproteobacteria bacterium]
MAESPVLRPGALALVTGASAGIGAAIAEALVERDCRVVCAARRRDRLEALARRLGSNCHPLELDVTDADASAGLIERLPAELREIDILVNNAGHDIGGRRRFDLGQAENWASIIETNVIGLIRVSQAVIPGMVARGRRRFDEGGADAWARIIETNVTGMIRVAHAVIPGMVARGRGHVVNLGSIAGLNVYPGGAAYNASKFAVHGFTGALRADYALSGVRVTEILPGTARTEFASTRLHGDEAKAKAFYDSFDTVLTAADVARCVVFALEQPAHVVVSQLVVVPTSQW